MVVSSFKGYFIIIIITRTLGMLYRHVCVYNKCTTHCLYILHCVMDGTRTCWLSVFILVSHYRKRPPALQRDQS